MKEIIYRIFLTAAVALIVATTGGCSSDDPTTGRTEDTYTLRFSADGTRTTLDGDRIVWQAGDRAGVFIGSTQPTVNAEATIDLADMLFTATVNAYAAGDLLHAYYPYYSGNTSTEASLRIPPLQQVDAGVYNGRYNPLVSVPYALTESADTPSAQLPRLLFRPLAAIVELHVFSADYGNELVQSVAFEADAPLAGNALYDLTQVSEQGELAPFAPTSERTVTVTLNTPTAVGADRTAPAIYLVAAPGTYSGTMVVETDRATYRLPVDGLTLRRAAIKPLGVNLTATGRDEGLVTGFYRWTLASGDIEAATASTSTAGDPAMRWNVAIGDASYAGWSNSGGYQIGSTASPAGSFVLSTDKYASPLSRVIVSARTGETATLAVYVDGTQAGQTVELTQTQTDYTFTTAEAATTSDLRIDFAPTARALYLYSITLIPEGYVPQALAVPAPAVSASNPTVVEWAPVTGATAYEYAIDSADPVRTELTSIDLTQIMGLGQIAVEYRVRVRALSDGVQYAATSDYSAPVAVTVPARPAGVGETWSYDFVSTTVWPLNGTASLEGTSGTTLNWTMSGASSSSWDNSTATWRLATNNNRSDTTLTCASYTEPVQSISLDLRTNSRRLVDVSVEVNGTALASDGQTTLQFGNNSSTQEGRVTFTSTAALSGTIVVRLTNPTGGFGLQGIRIN